MVSLKSKQEYLVETVAGVMCGVYSKLMTFTLHILAVCLAREGLVILLLSW